MEATTQMLHDRLGSLEDAIREGIVANGKWQAKVAQEIGQLATEQRNLAEIINRESIDSAEKLRGVINRIDENERSAAARVQSLDRRLRRIERFRWWIGGAVAVLVALIEGHVRHFFGS